MSNMAGIFSFLRYTDSKSLSLTHFYSLNDKCSVLLLLACSGLVAWRQQFGTAIDCIARDDIPTSFINDYCYIHSTYSFEESWNKSVGVDILFPGVDKYSPDATKVYHTYYQWVSLVLFVQSVLFGIPARFWKRMEAGKLQKHVSICRNVSRTEAEQQTNSEELVQSFLADSRNNGCYFISYCMADALKLTNVIGQMCLMDAFLGGGFFSYGVQMYKFAWNPTAHLDPKAIVFPKMVQCDYYNYGRTGDIQRHDVLCLLPINILNEKIYALLWFWFLLLVVLSFLTVLVDMLFLLSSYFRFKMLSAGFSFAEQCVVEKLVDRCNSGDWFLIVLVRKNINPRSFRDFVLCLTREWSQNDRDIARQLNKGERNYYESKEPVQNEERRVFLERVS